MKIMLITPVKGLGKAFDLVEVPESRVDDLCSRRLAYCWTRTIQKRFGSLVNDRTSPKAS